MARFQRGNIYQAAGAFYVRYWTDETDELGNPILVDGKPKRVQRSKYLCDEGGKCYATKKKMNGKNRFYFSPAVKMLALEEMQKINNGQGQEPRATARPIAIAVKPTQERQEPLRSKENTVVEFWDNTYFPFIQNHKTPATVNGYKHIWSQHLKPHFDKKTLKEYKTPIGTIFLTELAKTLSKNTVQHIRSLASGIFAHALAIGEVETNPWHDVKVLGNMKAPEETQHYTLDEAKKTIAALDGRPDCQLIVALACYLGLRPGEIQGLKWGDIQDGWIHISRSVVNGIVGETKTKSRRKMPLGKHVLVHVRAWAAAYMDMWACDSVPSDGWMFPNSNSNPVDLSNLTERTILPILKAKDIEWKTLYAGRRGAATILTELTGNAIAAQWLLGHSKPETTEKFYIKQMDDVGMRGMHLLEAEIERAGN